MNYVQWDIKAFLEKAQKGSFAAKAARGDVFKNNNLVFKAGGYRTDTGVEVELSDLSKSADATVFYEKEFNVADVPSLDCPTLTGTINKDCLSVAKDLIDKGLNPAVLNLADAYIACGWYYKGSKAQEESLCRQSTLSQTLYQYYDKKRSEECGAVFKQTKYPMDRNFGAVYSPYVTVFRKGQRACYAFMENPYQVAIISCAALNFNDKGAEDILLKAPDGGFNQEGKRVMLNKIRTIYRVGLSNGHDSLVLGAFGCGAFRLRPDKVATLFMDVLQEKEFANKFKCIVFAILESPDPTQSGLYGKFAPFYRVFGNYASPTKLVVESPKDASVNVSEEVVIKAGQRVRSPKFGEGIVKETDGTFALVDFSGGEKKLSLAYAKLEVIA
ncbi:MAG: TIGR02452 family protein [Bacteroidales bacterium]|nr:TIGR02452 family protein [Bacteroidales bacterium]